MTRAKTFSKALTYRRADRRHPIRTYITGAWQYKFNLDLFWLHNKIKSCLTGHKV